MRAVIVLAVLLLSTAPVSAGMCELRRPPEPGSKYPGRTEWAKDTKTQKQCVADAQKEKQKRYPTQELEIFYACSDCEDPKSKRVGAEKSKGKGK